jgi:hypothetical protein
MRIGGEEIGRRGAAALSLAAVAAAALAVHGYSSPGSLGVAPLTGSKPLAAAATPTPTPSSQPSPGVSPSSSPSAQPTASGTPGPLLSSTSYASYTYQLYPGTPSQTARLALSGFSYKVKSEGSSIVFTLNVLGGGQAPITNTYPASDHVYFVEASFGDDAQNTEYNYGDDGLVVTDASGHVVG